MEVEVPYGKAWEALEWAKENCPNYVTNTAEIVQDELDNEYIRVIFYFGHENDATLFALRWK